MPARNEAARLPDTLAAIGNEPLLRRLSLEVLIADDGSEDDTLQIATRAPSELNVRLLPSSNRPGVGHAVRGGVLAAQGERVLICDADGAVPFSCLDLLWEALDHGFDVAAGSRRLLAGSVEVPQPAHRIAIGKVWGKLVRHLTHPGVQDTQCGFKLFTRAAAQRVFSAARCKSFAFHVEALLLAQHAGLLVAEVPVRWRDVPGSKIRLRRDPTLMAAELAALAWRTRHWPAAGRSTGRFLHGGRRVANLTPLPAEVENLLEL